MILIVSLTQTLNEVLQGFIKQNVVKFHVGFLSSIMYLLAAKRIVYRMFNKKCVFCCCVGVVAMIILFLSIYKLLTHKDTHVLHNKPVVNLKGHSSKKINQNKEDKHKSRYVFNGESYIRVTPDENSIYFVDPTYNLQKRYSIISKRQACIIEAASRLHLGRNVYVLYRSPGKINYTRTESDKLITALMGYKNVFFVYVNVKDFFQNTPAERIYRMVRRSEYSVEWLNELFKLLLLWKYGGMFVGSDLLLVKNTDRLANNFLVAKSGRIDDVIMKFDTKRKAKIFLSETFRKFEDVYENGTVEYEHGEVITKTFRELCEITPMSEVIAKYCAGIKIYPPSYFMHYRPEKWKRYFDKDGQKVLQSIARSYGVRLWEQKSKDFKVPLNSTSTFKSLAKKYCPQIVRYSRNYI